MVLGCGFCGLLCDIGSRGLKVYFGFFGRGFEIVRLCIIKGVGKLKLLYWGKIRFNGVLFGLIIS